MNEQMYILKLFQDRLLGLTNLNTAFKPNFIILWSELLYERIKSFLYNSWYF